MKRLLSLTLVACLMVALGMVSAFAHTEADPFVTDMIADGGSLATATDVGDVLVWNDGSYLYVKYVIDPDWCITETHLQVASRLAGIPQRNGNPIPGHFVINEKHNCVSEAGPYEFALNGFSVEDTLHIAAHAKVWDKTSAANVTVVSNTSTQVIEVNGSPTTQDAVLAKEPVGYPNCASYIEDGINSAWDSGIGSSYTTIFTNAGAHWIWNTPHPENPIWGDVVTFQETFSVPGLPFNTDLLITADNAYIAYLNGSYVGNSISLGPGFPGTLKEQIISVPKDDDWEVASQGWQKVESFPLGGIVSGENTLKITAANEYMCGGDATFCNGYEGNDRYQGWNNTSKTYTLAINNDPIPGNGPGFYPCYNPGALIFMASVDYYARGETAWGDGTDFDGRNWATYFTYTVQE